MRTISATEAKQTFAGLLEAAAREPILIRRRTPDAAVMLSIQEMSASPA